MGRRKTWDLMIFMLIMYILPTTAVPDLIMSVIRHKPPILTSVSSLSLTMSFVGMLAGVKRIHKDQGLKLKFSTYFLLLLQTVRGSLYMLHWVIIMTSTTARMSFRPKRLKWVKTVHTGANHE
jgi:1,2-diacylglycerol 3-beta-glucosyltransferase